MTAVDRPPIDHRRRVAEIQGRLRDSDGVDALLLTHLTDVRWLTGFTGSNGWAVVRPDDLVLGTDGRYGDRARAETGPSGAAVVCETDRSALQARLLEALRGATAVGLDATTTPHAAWEHLVEQLPSAAHLVAVGSWIADARRVKDDAELARIGAAARAADAALAEVEPLLLRTGDAPVTEADVRDELEYRMRRHGADDRSYDTIVASGPEHAARPHHEASHRRIADGDTVVIDVGALVDGYHSDMTRSYVIGEPTDEQVEVYDLVARAQQAGLEAVAVGVPAADVDRACREVFVAAGRGDWYLHGTGHGVGLDIHEEPYLARTSTAALADGHVVTIEPGLYRGGFGGFRIEDLVVVTSSGPRVLTHSPKHRLGSS